jgi:hypothetical protein
LLTAGFASSFAARRFFAAAAILACFKAFVPNPASRSACSTRAL